MIFNYKLSRVIILIVLICFIGNFLLFINQARALLPVVDPVNLPFNTITSVMTTAEKILYYVMNYVIYPLIRKIANSLENKLVNKVNGVLSNIDGKAPAFITSWRNHLLDSQARGNDVFRTVLADTKLCPYFDQELKTMFGADKYAGVIAGAKVSGGGGVLFQNKTYVPGLPSFQTAANCTLPVGFDVDAFRQDFRNGGWAAWDSLLEPQNNVFGVYAMALAEQSQQMQTEEKSTMDSAVAGQGFLSQKLGTGNSGLGPTGCTDVSVPSDVGPTLSTRCVFMGKEVTPAKLLGESTANAIDAKLKRVGGATALTDILLNLFAAVTTGVTDKLYNYLGQATYDQPVSSDKSFPTTETAPGAFLAIPGEPAANPSYNNPDTMCLNNCMSSKANSCHDQAKTPGCPGGGSFIGSGSFDCYQIDQVLYDTCISQAQVLCDAQCP